MRKKGMKLLILTEEKSRHTFIQIANNLNIILLIVYDFKNTLRRERKWEKVLRIATIPFQNSAWLTNTLVWFLRIFY